MRGYELETKSGLKLSCIELGAAVTGLQLPDGNGQLVDVVLGYPDLDGYLQGRAYHGAVVGRHANRISRGHFRLPDAAVQLDCNEGDNHLHGGPAGFSQRVWQGHLVSDNCVAFKLCSEDGDQGYPGQLDVSVSYTLLSPLCVQVDINASTDRTTIVNLTQHSCFNLAGHDSGSIADHTLQLSANRFLPVDPELLPLGTLESVDNGPFDLRKPRRLGECLQSDAPQVLMAGGLDHSWVLDGELDGPSAVLHHPSSGRTLSMYTDQPVLQVYTGNHLASDVAGKGGAVYANHGGVCLEAQGYPNAPNVPQFSQARLEPGETYQRRIQWAFDMNVPANY